MNRRIVARLVPARRILPMPHIHRRYHGDRVAQLVVGAFYLAMGGLPDAGGTGSTAS